MTVRVLVLAAGQSRRFGGADKRLARMPDGGTLIQAMLRRSQKAELIAAVAHRPGDPISACLGTATIACPNAVQGMGSTIADAMGALQEDSAISAVMILPCDLPLLRVSTLKYIAAAAQQGAIVVPINRRRRGHPVCFGRRYFPELCQLAGDSGARQLLRRHRQDVVELEVDDPGIYLDADTPEQLAGLLTRMRPRALG